MKLPGFTLDRPASLDEAMQVAAAAGAGGFDWLAGGTDLLCNYKWRIQTRPRLISLRHLPELRGGAGTLAAGRTLWEIEHDERIRERWPAIAEAAASIATPLIRRTATLGGNLCLDTRCWHFNQTLEWRRAHGSCLKAEADVCRVLPEPGDSCVATYSGDLAPVLLVLGAVLTLAGPAGRREQSLAEFYAPDGIRRFRDRRPEEIVLEVKLPEEADTWRVAYRKLRLREAFDFPEGGVAAGVLWRAGKAAAVRVATTAYASVPMLHPGVASLLEGGRLDEEDVEAAAAALQREVRPLKNTSMSPAYRKKMARVLCRRALRACRESPRA